MSLPGSPWTFLSGCDTYLSLVYVFLYCLNNFTQRQKLPGRDCVVLNSPKDGQTPEEEEKDRKEKENLRSCLMSSYLSEIERRCNCSMRQAYLQQMESTQGELNPTYTLDKFGFLLKNHRETELHTLQCVAIF